MTLSAKIGRSSTLGTGKERGFPGGPSSEGEGDENRREMALRRKSAFLKMYTTEERCEAGERTSLSMAAGQGTYTCHRWCTHHRMLGKWWRAGRGKDSNVSRVAGSEASRKPHLDDHTPNITTSLDQCILDPLPQVLLSCPAQDPSGFDQHAGEELEDLPGLSVLLPDLDGGPHRRVVLFGVGRNLRQGGQACRSGGEHATGRERGVGRGGREVGGEDEGEDGGPRAPGGEAVERLSVAGKEVEEGENAVTGKWISSST